MRYIGAMVVIMFGIVVLYKLSDVATGLDLYFILLILAILVWVIVGGIIAACLGICGWLSRSQKVDITPDKEREQDARIKTIETEIEGKIASIDEEIKQIMAGESITTPIVNKAATALSFYERREEQARYTKWGKIIKWCMTILGMVSIIIVIGFLGDHIRNKIIQRPQLAQLVHFTVRVSADNVNIRKAPSSSASITAEVSRGSNLDVLETKGDWYRVQYYNDRRNRTEVGWIHKNLVVPAGSETNIAKTKPLPPAEQPTIPHVGEKTQKGIEKATSVNISGDWKGYYDYYESYTDWASRKPRKVEFQLQLQQNGSQIAGVTKEEVNFEILRSRIKGTIEGEKIVFEKRYDSPTIPPVNYEGIITKDGNSVSGIWRSGNWSGEWKMSRHGFTTDKEPQMAVLPAPPKIDPAKKLEGDIKRALGNAGLKGVIAEVNDDFSINFVEVTLKGSVASQYEKDMAFEIAKTFKEANMIIDIIFVTDKELQMRRTLYTRYGTLSISYVKEPQMAVLPAPPKIDPAKVEGDINKALGNAGLKGVIAEVNDNLEVTLKGSVASQYEKDRAFEIVKTFKEAKRIRDIIFVME